MLKKKRGQHSENPFETATLSKASLRPFIVTTGKLKEEVLRAWSLDEGHPLQVVMMRVMEDVKYLADTSILSVKEIMRG